MEDSANGQANFRTLSVLGELQIANGMVAEGKKTMDRALASPTGTPIDIHQAARFQQIQGNNELAREVFLANAKKHPATRRTSRI